MENFFSNKALINILKTNFEKLPKSNPNLKTLPKKYPIQKNHSEIKSQGESFNQVSKINFSNYQQVGRTLYLGLENLGQTCYMNSFLQALFLTTELREFLLNYQPNKTQPQPLINEMSTLFKKLYEPLKNRNPTEKSISPLSFKQTLHEHYRSSLNQEDVFLFGITLFDYMSEIEKNNNDEMDNEVN